MTELCDQGDLFDRVADPRTSYTERDAALLFRQVLHGLSHIHRAGFVHRDLKPENVFLKAPGASMWTDQAKTPLSTRARPLEVVVGDMGLAAVPTPEGKSEGAFEGTLPYAAPEQLSPPRFAFGFKSDVWAAGCILYILLCGRPPFYARGSGTRQEQEERMVEEILGGRVDLGEGLFKGVSKQAMSLLRGVLCVAVDRRLSVQAALDHDWFELTVPDVLEVERTIAARAGASEGKEKEGEGHDDGDCFSEIARVSSVRTVSSSISGSQASHGAGGEHLAD